MKYILVPGLLAATMLSSCQQPAASSNETAANAAATAPTTGAPTAAAARAAVGRYLQGQPNANLYVVDSASAVEVDTHWQVLVPRTDWAGRMPNKAAFEVDKASGEVRVLPVK
jgi:hypothetical protein